MNNITPVFCQLEQVLLILLEHVLQTVATAFF